MKANFRFWVGVSLVLVYAVIAAGAIVRVTGSGMGCPDWPKCFGYLIPPIERAQLDWKSQHEYNKGERECEAYPKGEMSNQVTN